MNDNSSEATYQKNLVRIAVNGLPAENILYAIAMDFFFLYRTPSHYFTIFPRLTLTRNLSIGVGHITASGALKLLCGLDAKRALAVMGDLPPPDKLRTNFEVSAQFHSLRHQAQNQAKAAYKMDYPLSPDGVQWILMVGPYWRTETLGPFPDEKSTVRTSKESDSSDWEEAIKLLNAKQKEPPELSELYLFSTPESYDRFERIFSSTDVEGLGPMWETSTSDS